MPPEPPVPIPRPSRRGVLGVTAVWGVGLLAGCAEGLTSPAASPTPTGRAAPGPDVRLAARALAAEQQQLALLAAVSQRFPALAGRLRSARAVHQRHVDLLADAAPASASPSATADTARVRAPRSPALALRAVVEGERRLLGRHRDAAVAAASGRLARVLASMAAASAQQAAVLGGLG